MKVQRREILLGTLAAGHGAVGGAKASASTADAPPCFLVHTEDDASVPAEKTLEFRAALRARGIAVAEHPSFE